jgi:hypothetical protein
MADELELTDVQAANWDRYMAAVRAGALRRTGLNDPDREFNLSRLRAAMEAQGGRRD